MFDYLNLIQKGSVPSLILDNKLLCFEVDKDNKWFKRAEYNGLEFIVRPDALLITGSVHKYWNDGKHNWNDFGVNDFLNVLSELFQTFGINPLLWRVQNLEYGVNVSLPMPAKIFIKRFLLAHKNKLKPGAVTYSGNGYMIKFEYGNYRIKVYDKSLHYNRPGNILRFEIGTNKVKHLERAGIYASNSNPLFLADLVEQDNIKRLKSFLLNTFDEMLIVDPEFKQRSEIKTILSNKTLNSNHYRKIEELTRNAVRFSDTKAIIRELIFNKLSQITRTDNRFFDSEVLFRYEWQNSLIEMGGINPFYKGVNSSLIAPQKMAVEKRFCQTCGRDISNQKSNSKFCSARIVGEVAAKACRNGDSNPRNNFKKTIIRLTTNTLFDTLPYITDARMELLYDSGIYKNGNRNSISV